MLEVRTAPGARGQPPIVHGSPRSVGPGAAGAGNPLGSPWNSEHLKLETFGVSGILEPKGTFQTKTDR